MRCRRARTNPARVSNPASRGRSQAILGFQVADVDRAFQHQHGLILQRGLARGDIEFVFDIADQLLQNVFYRDDSGGGSELVHHDREMAAALFEFGQQFRQEPWFPARPAHHA